MKRLLVYGISIICSATIISLNAQVPINIKAEYSKSGKKTEIMEFFSEDTSPLKIRMITEGKEEIKNANDLKDLKIVLASSRDFWFSQAIQGGVYENIAKKGFQFDVRKDMELDALNYLEKLEENNLILEDKFLENYLYSIVCNLYPTPIDDGRPGILNVVIMRDIIPNAFVCPNGTMLVTTGLLTTVNSREELTAALAHEISHFVLDHSLINVNEAIARQQRAEFWAGLATMLVAASEVYAASQNSFYIPGVLTYSTAILSFTLANQINTRLGLKFSKDQETEADNCAIELLKFNEMDPVALSSVLSKIRKYCVINGDYSALSGDGTHPNLKERIQNIGDPKDFNSSTYDRTVSLVISQNAILEFNNKHFKACQSLLDRIIISGVPTEDDFILKSMSNLCLFDNEEKNKEAYELICKAKELNVSPSINLPKQEALVLIRLNKKEDAIKALEGYLNEINKNYPELDKMVDANYWFASKEFLDKERDWTYKMIYKLKKS